MNESSSGDFPCPAAEYRRLLLESISSRLNLCYTIATFTDGMDFEPLREACSRTAWKGYQGILLTATRLGSALPETSRTKLDQLRDALNERQSDHDRNQDEVAPNHVPTTLIPASIAPPETAHGKGEELTPRETEVLKAIAEGHSTKQVAGMLGITFKTAACHRYRAMEKLHIHDTATLVHFAIRHGLVQA